MLFPSVSERLGKLPLFASARFSHSRLTPGDRREPVLPAHW